MVPPYWMGYLTSSSGQAQRRDERRADPGFGEKCGLNGIGFTREAGRGMLAQKRVELNQTNHPCRSEPKCDRGK
jgi:hypothetical protein